MCVCCSHVVISAVFVGLLLKLHAIDKQNEDALGVLLVLVLVAVCVAVAGMIAVEVSLARKLLKREEKIIELKEKIENGTDFEDIYNAGNEWVDLMTESLPFSESRPVVATSFRSAHTIKS